MGEESFADYAVGSPARLAINVLAHKWTMLIVLALKSRPLRFSELRRGVPGVTAQVLTASLRDLERDGIVLRQDFAESPVRVEYKLTPLGRSLCGPARAIRAWADEHVPDVLEARRRYDEIRVDEESDANR